MSNSAEGIQVEITKTVPVADLETLEAWLNQNLANELAEKDLELTNLGSLAMEMIDQAGLNITKRRSRKTKVSTESGEEYVSRHHRCQPLPFLCETNTRQWFGGFHVLLA